MEVSEIVRQIKEVDEEGVSKTFTGLHLYLKNDNKEEDFEEVTDSIACQPMINIREMSERTVIDLTFRSVYDVDLKRSWDMLEQFGDLLDMTTKKNNGQSPALCLTLIPEEANGTIYALATNPVMWALTALEAGREAITIRLVFHEEYVGFFYSPDIQVDDIKAEVQMEMDRREFIENEEERRKRLRQERADELTQMLGTTKY